MRGITKGTIYPTIIKSRLKTQVTDIAHNTCMKRCVQLRNEWDYNFIIEVAELHRLLKYFQNTNRPIARANVLTLLTLMKYITHMAFHHVLVTRISFYVTLWISMQCDITTIVKGAFILKMSVLSAAAQ